MSLCHCKTINSYIRLREDTFWRIFYGLVLSAEIPTFPEWSRWTCFCWFLGSARCLSPCESTDRLQSDFRFVQGSCASKQGTNQPFFKAALVCTRPRQRAHQLLKSHQSHSVQEGSEPPTAPVLQHCEPKTRTQTHLMIRFAQGGAECRFCWYRLHYKRSAIKCVCPLSAALFMSPKQQQQQHPGEAHSLLSGKHRWRAYCWMIIRKKTER